MNINIFNYLKEIVLVDLIKRYGIEPYLEEVWNIRVEDEVFEIALKY